MNRCSHHSHKTTFVHFIHINIEDTLELVSATRRPQAHFSSGLGFQRSVRSHTLIRKFKPLASQYHSIFSNKFKSRSSIEPKHERNSLTAQRPMPHIIISLNASRNGIVRSSRYCSEQSRGAALLRRPRLQLHQL